MSKDAIFYFNATLYNSDDDCYSGEVDGVPVRKSFIITNLDDFLIPEVHCSIKSSHAVQIYEPNDFSQCDHFLDQWSDLEGETGCQDATDWGSTPDSRVHSFGLYSNVLFSKIDSLMEKWRQYFIDIVGPDNVSPCIETLIENTDSDYDIYLKTKSKIRE